jgi:Fe-S-cluster containining protein
VRLHIPAFLNYECQACGACCRDYEIAMSAQKYDELNAVNWRAISGDPDLTRPFEPTPYEWTGGPYRFKLRPDGTCVFQSKDMRCLIHKQLGFAAKALACKLFPVTFAKTPVGIYVGVRYNCRAIALALGPPLQRDRENIEKLFDEFNLSGFLVSFPDTVKFDRHQQLSWDDYLKAERAMTNIILCPDRPLPQRVAAVWHMADMMREARLDKVAGERFGEFVDLLSNGIVSELQDDSLRKTLKQPGFTTRRLYHQFLFFLHRRRRSGSLKLTWRARMARRSEGLRTSIKFSFNTGSMVFFKDENQVRMRDIWKVELPPPDEQVTGVLERYLAGKIFGKQIFGPLFFNHTFVDGLAALLCAYGAILWYARASALSRGARKVEALDVLRGMQHVDYSFGYSPVPTIWTERLRLRYLAKGQTPARIATWLSEPPL